jgi:hypothetical protein
MYPVTERLLQEIDTLINRNISPPSPAVCLERSLSQYGFRFHEFSLMKRLCEVETTFARTPRTVAACCVACYVEFVGRDISRNDIADIFHIHKKTLRINIPLYLNCPEFMATLCTATVSEPS